MLSKRLLGPSPKPRHWFWEMLLEIFIIIIGVLVSIWITNLFQQGQDRRKESFYLQKIEYDLQRDLSQLSAERQQRVGQLEAAKEMTAALQAPSSGENIAKVMQGFQSLLVAVRFRTSDATFISLKSTGDLELLRNDSLVTGLIELYSNSFESLELNNEDVNTFRNNFILPYAVQYLDFRVRVIDASVRLESDFGPMNQLYNQALYESISLESTVDAYDQSIAAVERLLAMLGKELR